MLSARLINKIYHGRKPDKAQLPVPQLCFGNFTVFYRSKQDVRRAVV